MPTWFYYDNAGQKQGPVTGGQLKSLAQSGHITPETVIETDNGKTAKAGKVQGLMFVETKQPVAVQPQPASTDERRSLLAMPLLRDMEFNPDAVIRRLRNHWGVSIRDEDVNVSSPKDKTCVWHIEGYMVTMSLLPCRVPDGEFDSLFPVSLYWRNAEEETATHQSHVIVYVSSETGTAIERYSLFTKVVESILAETNSLGVYQGNQTLLISREIYLGMSQMLLNGDLPLLLWIFIGIGGSSKGNMLYTFGLTGFDKMEMEIVDSQQDVDDLYEFLVNICGYVISNDITFTKGETLGYTEDVAATIDISKGICLDGNTIKLKM